MISISVDLSIPGTKHLRRRLVRYFRRRYMWLDSTQRIISKRRNWRKTSNLRMNMHRLLVALASNLIDSEYIEWNENTTSNNTRLYRQSVRTPRWERFSRTNIEDCIVDPSYDQFLQLKMDEDLARYLAQNEPMGDCLTKWAEKDKREMVEYKLEYNRHIDIELIDNRERYESVLLWGYLSNLPPDIAAKVYEQKTLFFPEDLHVDVEGGRSFGIEHINDFIRKTFPERRW